MIKEALLHLMVNGAWWIDIRSELSGPYYYGYYCSPLSAIRRSKAAAQPVVHKLVFELRNLPWGGGTEFIAECNDSRFFIHWDNYCKVNRLCMLQPGEKRAEAHERLKGM